MRDGPGGETPDQKRTRRRWINLAELVAVAGVLIAALTLWNNWSERRAAEADKAGERQAAAQARGRFELRGTPDEGGDAIVLAHDSSHELHDVHVAFPTALGIAAQDATDHRIARDWVDKPLLKATDGGPSDRTGLLPVLIDYAWADENGDEHRGKGIYDIVWRTHGRPFPLGRALRLTDFRLHRKGGDQARLDAAWATEKPAG